MTTPSGPSGFAAAGRWGITGGGLGDSPAALVGRTREVVEDALKAQYIGDTVFASGDGPLAKVFHGLPDIPGAPLLVRVVAAIGGRLLGVDPATLVPSGTPGEQMAGALALLQKVPILGDLIEAITGIEDGDLNDLGTKMLEIRTRVETFWHALEGIDLTQPGAVLAAIAASLGSRFEDLLSAIQQQYDGDDETLQQINSAFVFVASVMSAAGDFIAAMSTMFGQDDWSALVDAVNDSPEALWGVVVTLFLKPLNAFATLVSGLIPGAQIPGLDASKIVSGLFTIAQVSGLGARLDDLDAAILAIPGAQELIDKICNALGVTGTGHTPSDVFTALTNIPGANIVGSIAAALVSGILSAANIPGLDASKITSGQFGQAMITGLSTALSDLEDGIDRSVSDIRDALNGSYAGSDPVLSAIKSIAAAFLTAASSLDATKLINTIAAARIPALDMSKVTTGSLEVARVIGAATATALADVQTFVNSLVNAILQAIRGIPVVGGTLADVIADLGGLNTTANTAASTANTAQSTANSASGAAASAVAQMNYAGAFSIWGATNPSMETTVPLSSLVKPAVSTTTTLSGSTNSVSGIMSHSHTINSGAAASTSTVSTSADPWAFDVTATATAMGFVRCKVSADKKVVQWVGKGTAPTAAVLHVYRMDPETGDMTWLQTKNVKTLLAATWKLIQVELDSAVHVEQGSILVAELCVTGGTHTIAGLSGLSWLTDDGSARPKRLGGSRNANAGSSAPATISDGSVPYNSSIPYFGFGQLLTALPPPPAAFTEPCDNLTSWDPVAGTWTADGSLRVNNADPHAIAFKYETTTDKVSSTWTPFDMASSAAMLAVGSIIRMGICSNAAMTQYVAIEFEVTSVTTGTYNYYTGNSKLVTAASPTGPSTARATLDTGKPLFAANIAYDPTTKAYAASVVNTLVGGITSGTWTDSGDLITHGPGYRRACFMVDPASGTDLKTLNTLTYKDI